MTKKYEGLVKLAIFESADKYPWRAIYTESEAKVTDYAQASEWLEVEFKFRADKDMIAVKVASIDSQIDTKLKETMEEIERLRTRKAELLAISYEPSVSPPSDNLVDDTPF